MRYFGAMTIALNEFQDVNRQVCENVTALMFRLGWKQQDMAAAIGINAVRFSRRLHGAGEWTASELQALAAVSSISVDELMGDLPSFDVWRARRDSNPKPSDLESGGIIISLAGYRVVA